MKDVKGVLTGLGVGSLAGVLVGVGSFFLIRGPQMGLVMFALVPFLSGFSISLVTERSSSTQAAIFLSLLVSLAFLVIGGFEGLLCAVMAFPFLIAGLVFGVAAGHVFRRRVLERLRHRAGATMLLLALAPVLAFAGRKVELRTSGDLRREIVSDSIFLQAPPEVVWAHIQSIDSINVSKPWLMYIGLPIPVRCTLERGGVGAKRTCYFNNGFIQETITEWSPPYHMGLSIDRTNMPGRHWLGFESAAYELHQEGNATRLTRTTTIASRLRPVWYWRYFERVGVASEHRYILNDLSQRMARLPLDATAGAGSVR